MSSSEFVVKFAERVLWLGVCAVMSSGKSSAAPPALSQLPTGARVTAGQVEIQNNGNTTTVQQGSAKAVVNWNSFDIGANASVNFVQPDASAVILNRVNSTQPSQIYGQMNANGQVYLVNPAGVYFAPGASVNVGGIVATTHQMSDADFLAGKTSFSRQGASGAVINEGKLQARLGGYIALLAPEVRNSGVMIATQGTVAMAAGESVTLNFGANSKLESITVTASEIKSLVENRLAVQAPEGLIILSARAGKDLIGSVVNSGTLEANGLTQSGGRIILDASSSVAHSGLLSANAAPESTASGGSVVAIADLANPKSQAVISGGIQARGGAKGGDGGFVETSAANIQIAATTKVDTRATAGRAGTWLIDPADFTIASGNTGTITAGTPSANVSGATLSTALSSGNVTILSSQGTAAGQGDINVNDTVSWSANQLTLTAARNININAVMTVSGGSTLVMQTGHANGVDAAVPGGTVNVGLNGDGSFKGRVDFAGRSGPGILTINGAGFSVINSLGVAGDATGAGSPATTLQGMAAAGNVSGNYVLGSNIDASGTSTWNMSTGATPVAAGFTPIGTSATAFSGVLDGLGHTITGLRINLPATASVGLFGATGGASTVRNVGLVGGSVSGASSVGSLSGANVGTISNAYATATVSGTTTVGGLLGSNTGGTVSNAYASGSVTGTSTVGGLMGSSTGGSVASSYAAGAVKGTTSVGGLMGSNTGIVTNSYATGNVTGGSIVGGLMGSSTTGTVTTTYATGNVVGTGSDVGGLMGTNVSVVSGACATGTVAGTSGVGGLIGTSSATVSSAYATGNVSGTSGTGGLIGTSSAAVTLSFATGNVTGTTGAGGLIGTSSETVSLSYAIGNVNGTTGSGGLIGTSSKAVSNAYATGSVTGTTGVGGLIGTSSAAVGQSLATGAVVGTTGSLAQGALVGTSSAAVSDSYWNSQTSLQANSIGTGTQQGVALTTAQMTQQTSFPGLVFGAPGSDPLTNPWTMLPGASSPMSRALTGSITVTANSVNQQYSSLAYAGNNGAIITGSTSATVLSATTYTGASQGAINVGQYAITPFLTSSNPQFVVVYVNGTLTLTAAPLAISVNNSTKVFGAANPVFSGVVTGFVGGDTLANSTSGVVTYASVATAASNVGNYAITASGLTANNGNYSISDIDGTLVTTRAALNITANSSTKVFGQTVAFNGSEFSSTGLQNGNSVGSVSLNSSGAAATANVLGSPYAIVASGATGGSFLASNYLITYTNGTLATTQAALNIAANNATKVFGQTVAFNGSEFSSTGLQNGNSVGSVSLASSGAAATANVLGSPYAITASGAAGGTFTASNYLITYTNGTLATAQAALNITANSTTKVFGQTVAFNGSEFSSTGLQNGNSVGSVSLASAGTAATANVLGSPYAIVASGATGGSFITSNYLITYINGTLATTQAALNITANNATKVFGQTLAFNGSEFSSTGLQNGNSVGSVSLASSGAAATANVLGSPYAIVASGAMGGSFIASNYLITYTNGSLATTQAALNIAANNATKVFGQTVAFNGSEFSSTGLQNGNSVGSVSLASSGAAATANVLGSPYVIVASGATGGSFIASNYLITYTNGTLATTQAALNITANNTTKVFGQTVAFNGSEFSSTGLQNGNSVGSVSLASSGAAATANVLGSPYAIVASGATGGSFIASNYLITYTNGALATTQAALNITANNATKVFGQTAAFNGSEFSSTGLQNGNSIGSVSLASVGAPAAATVLGSPYPIVASAATGGTFSASNYFITYSNGTMVVTAAPIPVPPVVSPTSGGGTLAVGSSPDQSSSGGAVPPTPSIQPSPIVTAQTTTTNPAAKFLARCSTVIDPSVTKSIPDCWGSP